jgi:HSP20 family molecular chaperone IbpA
MPSDSYLNSPHSMLENSSSYSILMNLLGIDMNDIGIRVNVDKREVAVLAKKESKNLKRGFFWVFGVPVEGLLTALSSRYRDGVLEIIIPKLPQDPIGIVH